MGKLTASIEARHDKNPTWLAWLVCLSGGLLFFYEFIQLNMFNAINVSLMQSFHINAHTLGNLSSVYFYADAGFLFVAGNLLDRFSTRRWILISMTFCTLGTIGFALSPTIVIAGIFRFIVGLGGAFCLLSGIRLATRWFEPRRMALVSGLLITMGMAGGWMAQAPLSALVEAIGWRGAIFIDGMLGIVLSAWLFYIIKDYPKGSEHLVKEDAAHLKERGLWSSLSEVLKGAQNWLAGFYIALLNLPIYLLGALWGTLFLRQIHHFTATNSAFIASMLFIGTIVGSPIAGWISDRMGSRRIPMAIGAVLSIVVVFIIMYVPALSYVQLLLLFFLLGLITSSQVIAYPLMAESNPKAFTGAAIGLGTMICVLSGAILQPVSGRLLDMNWHGKFCDGVHCYSLSAYQHAMWIFPIAFAISLVVVFFMKETHCRRVDQPTDSARSPY